MKKWLQVMGIIVISTMVLAACDSSSVDGDEETFKIGVSQFVEHPSLDLAYEGFQEALDDKGVHADFDYQNAQGDQNNVKPIADNFVADGVDLIFANATPSAQSAKNATNDIPIVFTSVTDAVGAELVEDMEAPGENITGVVDLHPDAIKETVRFMDEYFSEATVGLIYNSGEQNSVAQVEMAIEAGEGTGLNFTERTVSTSAEVQQAASSLVGEADVIYVMTDNTVVSAMDSVVDVANEQNIPLIAGEPESLEKGAFATYGIDYQSIGYRTGEMAAEILVDDKDPAEMDVEYPPEVELFINKEAAEEQEVEWNEDWGEANIVEVD